MESVYNNIKKANGFYLPDSAYLDLLYSPNSNLHRRQNKSKMVAQTTILDRVFHILAKSPPPEEVLAIQTTEEEDIRLRKLADRSKEGKLSMSEEWEFQQYIQAERYVRLAKAYAYAKINNLSI